MRPDLTHKIYTTADLCALIPAITPRQLQWWDERRVVMPFRRDGHKRQYRIEDALVVAIVAELRNKGLSLQRARAVARSLHLETGRRLMHLVSRGERPYLLVDGKSVLVETNPQRLLDRLSASAHHCYVVNVQDVVAILASEPKPAAFRQAV